MTVAAETQTGPCAATPCMGWCILDGCRCDDPEAKRDADAARLEALEEADRRRRVAEVALEALVKGVRDAMDQHPDVVDVTREHDDGVADHQVLVMTDSGNPFIISVVPA